MPTTTLSLVCLAIGWRSVEVSGSNVEHAPVHVQLLEKCHILWGLQAQINVSRLSHNIAFSPIKIWASAESC